jgi:hypothetical protein
VVVAEEGEPAVAVGDEVRGELAGGALVAGADGVDAVDGRAGQQHHRQAGGGYAGHGGVGGGAAEDGHAVHPPGELLHGGVRVAPVRGQDEDAAAELRGGLLVAEHHLGVVRADEVGEDDAVGGVPALGERAAEPAGGVVELLDGGAHPGPGVGGDQVGVAQGAGHRGDGHARSARYLVDGRGLSF